MIPLCNMNKQAGLVMVHGQVRIHLEEGREMRKQTRRDSRIRESLRQMGGD